MKPLNPCVKLQHLATRMATQGTHIIGTLSEFDDANDEWNEYIERLEHLFTANEITDEDKKKSICLVLVEAKHTSFSEICWRQ